MLKAGRIRASLPTSAARLRGGVLLAGTVALAASFLSEHYGAPAMLFALLIGMAFNYLAENPGTRPGLDVCSSTLLRLGVALLGLRLTLDDVGEIGILPVAALALFILVTIACGVLAARAFGRSLAFGLLTGGAVAICGASAALAIAAILPRRHLRDEDVPLTVLGVTALSTVAMVLYPVLFTAFGFDEVQSGYLIGATIHDVAQVVGAGYSISERAGDLATFTKLVRVALLPVVLVCIGLLYRHEPARLAPVPWFVAGFVVLMVLRNVLPIPEALLVWISHASLFMLLTAIAALGVKTSLGRIFAAGPGGLAMVGIETLVLLALALLLLHGFAI